MAGTVTSNLIDISLCEATTGWTSLGGTLAVNDPTVFDAKQGSYCLQVYGAAAGDRGAEWLWTTDQDFSDKILVIWMAFSKKNYGANPVKFKLTDAVGNWSEWNMFSQGELPHGGWIPWALKPTVTPDAISGTLDLATIRKFSWLTVAGAAKVYFYWDAVRYGYGLSIKSGTEASPAVLEDFVIAENTNAYGIVEKYNGIYFVQGILTIGSLTAEESTYFKDLSQVIQFKSMKGEPSGFYEIKGQNATSGAGTTEIYFGDPTSEVSGLFIKAPSAMKFKLTMSDTYITKFGFYGCSFVNADTIALQPYNADKKLVNCNFETCAEVLANTCAMTGCNFISSAGRAVKISSASHNVTKSNFINCQTAIHHDVGGPSGTPLEYDYDALMFTGGTYHIENSAVTPNFYIDIDRLNGSNPDAAKINNSNGGSTTILPISVILTLTGLIAGSDVRIMNAGTTTILAGTDNSTTTFDYSYNYGEYPNVDIIVLHLDYEYFRLDNFTPGSSNASLPIPLRKDRWYSNP